MLCILIVGNCLALRIKNWHKAYNEINCLVANLLVREC